MPPPWLPRPRPRLLRLPPRLPCRRGPGRRRQPSARKILDEKGIAAADVAGTGRGGRVTKEDAVAAQKAAAPAAGPVVAAAARSALPVPPTGVDVQASRTEQRVPMSRLRARVAERLVSRNRPTPS